MKPPGRGADVDAIASVELDLDLVEGVRDLLATARDVERRRLDRQLRVLVDLLPGLVVAGHESREDERLGLRAALREPALHEQDVEPFPHRRTIARSMVARGSMPCRRSWTGSGACSSVCWRPSRRTAASGPSSCSAPWRGAPATSSPISTPASGSLTTPGTARWPPCRQRCAGSASSSTCSSGRRSTRRISSPSTRTGRRWTCSCSAPRRRRGVSRRPSSSTIPMGFSPSPGHRRRFGPRRPRCANGPSSRGSRSRTSTSTCGADRSGRPARSSRKRAGTSCSSMRRDSGSRTPSSGSRASSTMSTPRFRRGSRRPWRRSTRGELRRAAVALADVLEAYEPPPLARFVRARLA